MSEHFIHRMQKEKWAEENKHLFADLDKFRDFTKEEAEKCEYCTGNWYEKKPLMKNGRGDYFVKINSCNYLEDSEVGDFKVKFSLFGERINFCPMCGRELEKS